MDTFGGTLKLDYSLQLDAGSSKKFFCNRGFPSDTLLLATGRFLMGIILAEAIGIYDGKYVAQTQSYGPEARGGSSKAEVVVSNEEIDYPKAMKLDLLLAMNQKSCDDY